MAINLSGTGVPTGTDVEVEIKIHTRLNISSYVAKQKANVCLALHCGQRIFWLVPVWLSTPQGGRQTKIGELAIDAQTGEVVEAGERCRTFKQIANALLQTPSAVPPA